MNRSKDDGAAAPLRVAALLSGAGSNLETLLEARESGRLDLDVVRVISNRSDARGLAIAAAAGVPTTVIDAGCAGPMGQDAAIHATLSDCSPDLVLLTGYMRILGAPLVEAWRGRMVNQHPSLLPKYKGLHTHRRALEAGDTEHGASVHFVTPELDGGPVVARVLVPVEAGEDEASLAARLRPREHALLVAVMDLFAQRRLALAADGVRLDGALLAQPLELHGDALDV